MRASNAPKKALSIISHIRFVFAPTVVDFVTLKAGVHQSSTRFNRLQQAGHKLFNKNHLETTRFYRVQQALASGSGPEGRLKLFRMCCQLAIRAARFRPEADVSIKTVSESPRRKRFSDREKWRAL